MKIGLGIGGAAFALVAIGSLSDADTKTKPERSSTASSKTGYGGSASAPTNTKAAPSVAPVGSSVRDGQFEFQVLGIERGATAMEDVFNTERAKGEFFTVKLRVTNVGDRARAFSASSQKLIINGNKYDATSFLGSNSWREDINPGLSIDGEATFDIPTGAVPEAIECHDSMLSGGALLALPSKVN